MITSAIVSSLSEIDDNKKSSLPDLVGIVLQHILLLAIRSALQPWSLWVGEGRWIMLTQQNSDHLISLNISRVIRIFSPLAAWFGSIMVIFTIWFTLALECHKPTLFRYHEHLFCRSIRRKSMKAYRKYEYTIIAVCLAKCVSFPSKSILHTVTWNIKICLIFRNNIFCRLKENVNNLVKLTPKLRWKSFANYS